MHWLCAQEESTPLMTNGSNVDALFSATPFPGKE
jgi:hypothetical protein